MNKDAKIELEDAKYLARTKQEALENVYTILTNEALGDQLRLSRSIEYLSYKLGVNV